MHGGPSRERKLKLEKMPFKKPLLFKSSPYFHHKEKIFFFLSLSLSTSFLPSFFLSYLYEMIDVNQTYYGTHFTIYVSQVTTLYTLELYSAVCQVCT